jgi:hypothetical protein
VSEANESQTSYSVEQADIFQYQSYSHSDDMQHCLILSFISPLQGNIFISNPLSLLYIATLSDPILYLSFTRQHFHIQSFISKGLNMKMLPCKGEIKDRIRQCCNVKER